MSINIRFKIEESDF